MPENKHRATVHLRCEPAARIFRHLIVVGTLVLSLAPVCLAQTEKSVSEYTIGKGDLLAISFWQRPELDANARVDATGNIQLSLIGSIPAAGLTLSQLRNNILNRITPVDIRITQVSVVVREYASSVVYVTGSVARPGKLMFETIPDLWQIILEAGGPLPTAQLNEVMITRARGKDAGKVIRVDLDSALEGENLSALPPVYTGDNVNVPGAVVSPGATIPQAAISNQPTIHVFGQVVTPGVFNFTPEMNLFDAIVLAGGPNTTANMKRVQVFFRGYRQAEVAIIDMQQYMRRSTPLPPLLHPGDAIYVPPKKQFSTFVSQSLRIVFTSTASFFLFRVLQSL